MWRAEASNTAKAVSDGTWKSEQIWDGMKQGLVDLADFNSKVPADVQALVKEKAELRDHGGPGVRFQGSVVYPRGTVLDRTTLTPRDDGTVRQLIEISSDGGDTWRVSFDGLYRRVSAGG